MKVTILECPPGFVATNNTNLSQCNCFDDISVSYSGNLLCDQSSFTAKLSGGHWMGKVKNNETLVGSCPPQYCLKSLTRKHSLLPDGFDELDSFICGDQKRTGTLCGRCKEGYGPAVNSRSKRFDCAYCKNINVAAHVTYYVLAVYLPLFLLFLAIIVFNIKLTTGPANAFILYSQVISSTFDLSADGEIPLQASIKYSDKLLLAYQFPYGIFNLRFFEQLMKPFCLNSTFNTLDILILDYVVGFFPLLMILFIILCVKIKGSLRGMCRCPVMPSCSRVFRHFPRIRDSIIPAFASFLLLSYSKFSLTSSYLITRRSLIDEHGNSVDSRVYYAGQYSSSDSEYILRYMIPAIVLMVLLSGLPPLLLLHYPLKWFEMAIGKVDCLRKCYPTSKVQIFLDAFQGSFRHRMRFFAGLYFMFRLTIDLSYTLSTSWVQHYIVQEIVCIVFIILLTFCRPYKSEYHVLNFVDILMFANLAIITALGLYLYVIPHINPYQSPSRVAFVLQYILVLLPMCFMILYLLWYHLIPRMLQFFLNFKSGESNRRINHSSFLNSRSFTHTNTWPGRNGQKNFETSDSGIDWNRATLRNTYRRSQMSPPQTPENTAGQENAEHYGDTRSGDSSDSIKSPLSPNSAIVIANNYGSTTSGNTSSSSCSNSGARYWSSGQGHTPEQQESKEQLVHCED